MESVGTLLRSERTRQNRDLAEIAAALCITQAYLSAIESDDLKSLPGVFFYKSFVKQYAKLLGLSESQIQPGIAAQMAPAAEPPLPGKDLRYERPKPRLQEHLAGEFQKLLHSFDAPHASSRLQANREEAPLGVMDPVVESTNRHFSGHRMGASVAGLLAVLLFCSGFYAWWNRAPKMGPVEAASSAPRPAATPVQPVSVAAAAGASPSTPSISVTTSQADDGRAVLNLSATDEVWLSVTANGKEVFSGVLMPSQTKTLTGIEAAQMKVGNAGGLDVRWNGKAIGPIGPRGQVRTVVLTPENFEILPPAPSLDDTL